jgi:hypothetical protein
MKNKIIHPLDAVPEEKVDVSNLPPMELTRTVKWSLIALRGYLILMIVMIFIKVVIMGRG